MSNRELVQEQWEAFNRGDLAAAAEFFAEDGRNHGRPVSRSGMLAFPDVQFAPIPYMTGGEWVTVRGTFSATHQGVG